MLFLFTSGFRSLLLSSKIYRVSIKSFPVYKHLLQENYVEYKYIFLPSLKLVSKILCHVFIVILQLYNLCIPRSFLVINVCNQGKTLYLPCSLLQYKRCRRITNKHAQRWCSGGFCYETRRDVAGQSVTSVSKQISCLIFKRSLSFRLLKWRTLHCVETSETD
jgi:hypothetical protein